MTESASSTFATAAQQDPVINIIEQDPPVANDAGASSGSRERVGNLEQAARDAVAAHRRREFDVKDAPYQFAFEDLGPSLVTEHHRSDVVTSMMDLVQAKSWQRIRVAGHTAFRRETWLQATLLGIRVSGYEPKTAELARLSDARREHLSNRIEGSAKLPDASSSGQADDAAVPEQPSSYIRHMPPVPPVPPVPQVGDSGRVGAELPVAAAAAALTTAPPLDANDRGSARDDVPDSHRESGEWVEHGGAQLQHNPARSESDYVVYQDPVGANHVVSGTDLERALVQSRAALGERITLENLGKRRVSVEAPVVEATGRVIGQQEKEAYRNTWQIDVERAEQTRSVQSTSRDGAADRAPGEIVSGAPRAPTHTPRHSRSEQSVTAQRAMQLAVIVAAMRAQGFSERSISRVERHAERMIDAFHAEGVRIPPPRVFDPLAPSVRGRHAPNAPDRAASREIERALSEPSAPPL
ncbi:DNA primase [Caballeronia sp. SEWSISQ10-4 2]|uniref:LPD7 domain-containing protein n=1 Tax=Caballeronia sp. SEWSISQ10-4 2 TaxID=2937438 RepID=UPI0026533425|nr:LPD7 domain-containing protein [Caballeronia sp. SEWSISQ10-4 2]MDN7179377.1 DNA primase [Caballeronia sp. SEWSISQ10-4 2]